MLLTTCLPIPWLTHSSYPASLPRPGRGAPQHLPPERPRVVQAALTRTHPPQQQQ